ncbi:NUDIX hydrolase [Sphingomonas sp. Leaf357]|uniref:CoA pyrophosphatase n=1 Tax=Sphingomonas sp. Leaf357 TaxID=1736350 RepID=UPI0006F820A9|nr:CoA pyrophosphatase [Sphingomonas sp. Leaf357]KQS04432.1 NUDIX hydrolase [Sphingomonas sp. Leaf357]
MTLAERLSRALESGHAQDMALLTGDHRDGAPDIATPTQAAVLIAVTERAAPGVLLTRRTDTLSNHPGQVAFPGGRIDAGDSGPVAAALREAEEEIALPAASVQIIGIADRYRTITGFEVTPVIGVVPPDLVLTPSEAEVAEVFEVPLDFILDSANHLEAAVEWQGHNRHYYEIFWNDQRIWGATAAMIVNLSRRLRWGS